MINLRKRWYPAVYGTLSVTLLLNSARDAARGGAQRRSAFAELATHAGPATYLASLYLRRRGRTSTALPVLRGSGLAGALLSTALTPRRPASWATWATVAANELYLRWYARLHRVPSSALQVGAPLPDATLTGLDGQPVRLRDLRGTPTAILMYRGNWCPLCVAQVGELAARWRELADLGVRVVLVSPQGDAQTRRLAARFDVPFTYLLDPELHAAASLGLVHRDGVPVGLLGYGADTVFPTVIVTDRAGTVVFCDQTDDYRLRPDPELILSALRGVA